MHTHTHTRAVVDGENRYYHQHLDTWWRLLPTACYDYAGNVIGFVYYVQMFHDHRDRLRCYWSTLEQFSVAFYRNTLNWDKFFHILKFLHFSDNKNEPDKTNNNYDRLQNMRITLINQWCICLILQPNWTFSSWWSRCTFQRCGCLQIVYTKETQVVWHKNVQTVWF
jgi:hypothetical protein